MNLTEFNTLIVDDARSARNFISTLIGYPFSTSKENSSKAILNIYSNLSDDIKKDHKEFAPVFFKFFQNFKINEENIEYFNEYYPHWTSDKVEEIKQLNPLFKFETTTFKNSRTFTIALEKTVDFKSFIKQHHETIVQLIKKEKDKDNFITNLTNLKAYHKIINKDFYFFLKFNEQYNIDSNLILNNNASAINFVIQWSDDPENIDKILQYISSNKDDLKLLTYPLFFANSKENLVGMIFKLLEGTQVNANNLKIASLVTLFDSEITDILNAKEKTFNNDIYRKETWLNLIEEQINFYIYVPNHDKQGKSNAMIKKLDDIIQLINNKKLSDHLSNTIPLAQNIKKNKI